MRNSAADRGGQLKFANRLGQELTMSGDIASASDCCSLRIASASFKIAARSAIGPRGQSAREQWASFRLILRKRRP